MAPVAPRYAFVCYSHADVARMRRLVAECAAQGIATWYDDGIEPGSNWRDELAEAIQNAGVFLYLVSGESVVSPVCLQEVDFALDRGIRMLVVELEAVDLPARLAFRFGHQQYLKHRPDDEVASHREAVAAVAKLLGAEAQTASAGPQPAASYALGEITVAVGIVGDVEGQDASALGNAICRYVTWNGGPFRAVRARAGPEPQGAYVVELNFQAGDSLVLTWHLIDAASDEIVWSNRHAEPVETYGQRRDRIADMIAEGAVERIQKHRRKRAEAIDDVNQLSYWDLIFRSDHFQGVDAARVGRQRALLEAATARFPERAAAHAALASFLAWEVVNGISEDPNACADRATQEAYTAVDTDADDPYVLVKCGTTHSRLGEHERGISLCRRAYSLAPAMAAKEALARCLCFAGEPDEAIDLFHEILDTMPAGHVFQYGKLAVPLIQAGRLEEALEYCSQSTIHFPRDYYGWLLHANVLALIDDPKARDALDEARRLMPGITLEAALAGTERTYGRTPEQRRWLTGGLRRLLAEDA